MIQEKHKGMFQYKNIVKESNGTLTVGNIKDVPDITESTIGAPAAWFLGPRAENEDLFREMITQAIDKAVAYRTEYKKDDPEVINENVKNTPEYKTAVKYMGKAYGELVDFIKNYTTPYFSMRYQGHMLWDNTLPALGAYFATMLHNPNNVTIQASSATTPLEILVGWDLCGMVGFPVSNNATTEEFNPWAHITCDGSVANIETTWACRETKFFLFALRRLLTETKAFEYKNAQGETIVKHIDNLSHPITFKTSSGDTIGLADATPDTWKMFNIPMDTILGLPKKIADSYGIEDEYIVWSAAVPFTLNYLGWTNMTSYIHGLNSNARMPVMIAPSTMHYSWPKAAAFNGYGFGEPDFEAPNNSSHGCMFNIPVDKDARMDMDELEKVLAHCSDNQIPVTLVVGVTGSTEEGAVDPLETILAKRNTYRSKGLEYFVHADAAWGGYMVTGMRTPYSFDKTVADAEKDPEDPTYDPATPFVKPDDSALSDYVYTQYSNIRNCDSVTIDPHKMGYVQYPAGSILYRNGIIRRLTTFTGAYIGGTGSVDPGSEPTVGIFGLEGSKPGAAAAAVYLNHRVIRPDISGHGQIIKQSMINTKLFALYLLALNYNNNTDYQVTLLTNNVNMEPVIKGTNILEMKLEDVLTELNNGAFRNFGPDLNILDYVFNPLDISGRPNNDIDVLNMFNQAVYNQFHVPVSKDSPSPLPVPIAYFPDYFLTKTTFERNEYGGTFIDNFTNRIFDGPSNTPKQPIESIDCLRSVVMDPFMPYAQGGDFFITIVKTIDEAVRKLVHQARNKS